MSSQNKTSGVYTISIRGQDKPITLVALRADRAFNRWQFVLSDNVYVDLNPADVIMMTVTLDNPLFKVKANAEL